MIVNPITNGIVLDHITAGKGMEIYKVLMLGELDCSVAVITNAGSRKMGKKDIIKIDRVIDLDFDVLGFLDPGITVNVIEDGNLTKRPPLELPERITDIVKCKNPRCITSCEQELPHVFVLRDRARGEYRCLYCETKAQTKGH